LAAVGVLALTVAATGTSTANPALAAVDHRLGFEATVMGWTSWYGNYGLGTAGTGWCVDHGLRAPDAAFGYVPTTVREVDANHAAAIAWAVSATPVSDAVTAAAVMLAVHDLRGAVYPFGRLDVDTMTSSNLAGFGGNEWAVLSKARAIKADAWNHHHLRAPLSLVAGVDAVEPGQASVLQLRLIDGNGVAVAGMGIDVRAEGARANGPTHLVTAANGSATFGFTAAEGRNAFVATAVVPDPELHAFGPRSVMAQRIARPSTLTITARNEFITAPPTTTTPPTTTPPTTTPPTTTPPTTTSPAAPEAPNPPAIVTQVRATSLPRTGSHTGQLTLIGVVAVTGGLGLEALSRRSRRRSLRH
jgi:hypothetical protein